MTPMSETELQAMRAELEELSLPGTAVLMAPTYTKKPGGGGSIAYNPAGTVACRITSQSPKQDAEPVVGGKITADQDYTVTLPAHTEIRDDWRVKIDDATFEVTNLHVPQSFEVARRVEVSQAI